MFNMKWFKHDSDASNDAKLKKLRLKYGAQGYGIYWYCLELIARNVEKHNLTFELEHDAELIADDFKLSADIVQHIMTYMVELELFENTDGIISCLKMASRTDEYTQKLLKNTDKLPTIFRQYPDVVPTISVLREEKRREENKEAKPSTRGSRLKEDWKPSDELLAWAKKERPDLVIERTIDTFVDYWVAVPGSKGVKNDWDRTFKNWVRNEKSFNGKQNAKTVESGSSLRGLPGMVS